MGNKQVVEAIIEGRITPLPDCYSENADDPIFLRAQNIEEGYLNFQDAKRLTPQAFEAEPKAILLDGDIVLTIDGALLGIAAVHRVGDEPCCVSNHMVRIHHGEKTDPDYLTWLLNSPLGQQQIQRGITGSAIPGIRADAIERILVPVPPLDIQQALVADLEAARAARKQKLAEADALLAGVDEFVMRQLGLTVPQEEKRLAFAVRLGEMLPARVDSHFYKPYLRKTEEAIAGLPFQKMALHTLLDSAPINGIDAREYLATGQRYLRVQNVRPYELLLSDVKYVASESAKDVSLKSGDVLLTRKGTFGVATSVPSEAEDCLISSEIILLRLRQSVSCLPDYLVAWLNNSMAQRLLERYKTGGIMGHITQDVVSEFPVPLPPLSIQQTIAAEVARRREQARRLREEANTGWQAAKARFEAQLLSR